MKKIILAVLLCTHGCFSLSDVEIDFVSQLVRFLSHSNCVLVDDPAGIQHFSRNFISSSYLPVRRISSFLSHQQRYTTQRIVFAVKGHDLSAYEAVFDELFYLRLISRFTWIAIMNSTLDLSMIPSQIMIPYNSEFFLVEPAGENYIIREIYRERNLPKMYSNFYGFWSRNHGLVASKRNLFSRRNNMEGYPMTVLIPEMKCPTPLYCSLREIWFDLALFLNITTILLTMDEYERKIWETNEEVLWDVNLDPMTYDSYTFTTKAIAPIWKLTVYMHVRHESDQEFSWPLYFSMMWSSSFIYFFLWMVILSLWLTLFEYLNDTILHQRRFYSSNGIFAVWYWICNQGGIYMEPKISLLFVILLVRVVVLGVQILGTGSLVSSIALRIPRYPFYGLQEFLVDGTYHLGIVNGSLSQYYFKPSPISYDNDTLFHYFRVKEMPLSLIEAMEMLCADGKFVVLAEDNDLMALDGSKCPILRIPIPVASIFCGIPLEDESPFEFIFDSAFIETGMIDKLRKSVYEEVFEEKESHLHPITFLHVKAFFVIVEYGIILSVVICVIEMLYYARGRSHTRKNQRKAKRHRRLFKTNGFHLCDTLYK